MRAASHILWRVNNEYWKRLSHAQTLLNLLEQVLFMQRDPRQEHTLAALDYIRSQIDLTSEEHREWRYRFYYESLDTRRMVQDERAAGQALSRFSRMRSQQEARLHDLYSLVYSLPRPDPSLTNVPNGDLWMMTAEAIEGLVMFDTFLSEVSQISL